MHGEIALTECRANAIAGEWIGNWVKTPQFEQSQTRQLMGDLGELCVVQCLSSRENEAQLCSRLSGAWDVLHGIWSEAAPAFAKKAHWPEQPTPNEQVQIDRARHAIWYRCDPLKGFQQGHDGPDFTRFDRDHFAEIIAAYLDRPWMRHPAIDWILVDISVTRELCAYREWLKKNFMPSWRESLGIFVIDRIFRILDRLSRRPTPSDTWDEMYEVWRRLEPPVINPGRVREAMSKASDKGAVWGAATWSLVDRVIAIDPAVWLPFPKRASPEV